MKKFGFTETEIVYAASRGADLQTSETLCIALKNITRYVYPGGRMPTMTICLLYANFLASSLRSISS